MEKKLKQTNILSHSFKQHILHFRHSGGSSNQNNLFNLILLDKIDISDYFWNHSYAKNLYKVNALIFSSSPCSSQKQLKLPSQVLVLCQTDPHRGLQTQSESLLPWSQCHPSNLQSEETRKSRCYQIVFHITELG